jgi:hypothetical protein
VPEIKRVVKNSAMRSELRWFLRPECRVAPHTVFSKYCILVAKKIAEERRSE